MISEVISILSPRSAPLFTCTGGATGPVRTGWGDDSLLGAGTMQPATTRNSTLSKRFIAIGLQPRSSVHKPFALK